MSTTPAPPKPLRQANSVEARIVRQKIWRQCNVENEHFMAAIVGREGSGKSLTGIKLAEVADPSFDATRVMFEPQAFLERLRQWKANNETTGKMVVADEAGVGLGVRTWYQEDQIMFNQVLQVIRDENMGIIFTLPRLNELDSQARGRLHAFLEMTDIKKGEWAELKWLNWDPTRDERDKIYRKYPRLRINGKQRPVKRLRFGPPSTELTSDYEERKNEFQENLYQDAIDAMDDDSGKDNVDEMTVKEVAMDVADGRMEQFVSQHRQNNTPYINKDLLRAEYEISHADANAAKSILEQRFSDEELLEYV